MTRLRSLGAPGDGSRGLRSFAHARPARGQARQIWWLHPAAFCALFTLPVYLLIFYRLRNVGQDSTIRLQYAAPVFITDLDLIFAVVAIAALCVGTVLGARSWRGDMPARAAASPDCRGLDLLFWTTLFAYAYWFGPIAIGSPAFFLKALQGDAMAVAGIRDVAETTPGITTLTQFGAAYASIYMISYGTGNDSLRRRHHFYAAAILLLGALRALVWSERIALFELLAVMAIVACRHRPPRSALLRVPLFLGPYFAALSVPIMFIIFEMRRSWATTYHRLYDSVVQFGLDRIDIYYFSALNNGAGFFHIGQGPNFAGYFTLEWLYKMPVIGDLMLDLSPNTAFRDYAFFLSRNADMEFNNIAGLFSVFLDWGYVGGSFWLFATGLLLGLSYRRFVEGAGVLQYLYPFGIYFLFELPRIYYIGGSRVFVAALGCMLFHIVSKPRRAPAPAPRPSLLRII